MEDSLVFEETTEVGGRLVTLQTGKLAKQADGAVLIEVGETSVFAAVCRAPSREGIDFFPLSVEYRERANAAGRFPGGFIKREGRPSEKEILTCRLVDRPLRPLFPENYREEVQVICEVFSADHEVDPDVLAITAASAALSISSIPFEGPMGAVRMGLIRDRYIVNPSYEEREESQLDLVVAATKDGVVMVEAGAAEIPEQKMLEAIKIATREIKKLIGAQELLVGKLKPTKLQVAPADLTFYQSVKDTLYPEFYRRLTLPQKAERYKAIETYLEELKTRYCAAEDPKAVSSLVLSDAVDRVKCQILIDIAIKENRRMDGRGFEEIRPISSEVGIFKRPHGSALFTRGETQALVLTTLGTGKDEQKVETLQHETSKRFMLHYNFPPFSVGEVRPIRGVGRREVGHGALAERSFLSILPTPQKFPYTIGIVSEILESNGSSSMATVCGATLSLMDAGVPIRQPIAGVAMGLIESNNQYRILTDIADAEDHYGCMDLKIAGSQLGITAMQMDIKTKRIPFAVLSDALAQALRGRLYVLKKMLEVLPRPRTQTSPYAPSILTLKVAQEEIGTVIGPGGRMIKKIQEETGAEIDIRDDGTVYIYCRLPEGAKKAFNKIQGLTEKAVIGKEYSGTVTSTKHFGAFVEFLPGQEGLIHVSELDNGYVDKVTDIVKVGDQLQVRILGIDDQNRIKLSRKACLEGGSTTTPTPPASSPPQKHR
jgi:polyribonucleotide nucleotidyltransferase